LAAGLNQPLETYQDEIYLSGLGGDKPILPANLSALEDLARQRMTAESFDYICGGAGSEDSVRENAAAFRRWRIVPRMLTDVSAADYSSTVLGTELAAPIMLGPVGVLKLAHPEGEVAVAKAAAAASVPMILSTSASCTIEDVAKANGDGQRWFQLYWPKDRDLAASLLRRARTAGFGVLVLTLDTRLLGWRPRDLDRAFLPFLRGIGNQNYFSDPVFVAGLPGQAADHQDAAILRWAELFGDASITWEDLPFLRDHWDGPIVLKGIQSPGDAKRAADAGMDGIVVSNHGGRQVDGGIAALDALPPITAAVGSALTVLFDSGIRSGADVLKALALGARAVLIARPYVYALALAGEDGVRHVLRALRQEFELTMQLSGYASLAELGQDALIRVR